MSGKASVPTAPVELGRFLRARWRRCAVVAVLPVTAVVGALAFESSAPTRFEGVVTVVVPALGPDVVGALPAAESFRALLTGQVVAERVAATLDRPPARVRGRLHATQRGRGNLVEVRFRDRDRRSAAAGAKTAVQAAFEAVFDVELEAARRLAEMAQARAGGPESERSLAEARAALDRVTARLEASVAQAGGVRTRAVPSSTRPAQGAGAVSLLLAGLGLAGWEWARPAEVGPRGDGREGGAGDRAGAGSIRVGAGR